MKKIIFRADGNAEIGAGHIMRCLSFANAARQMGVKCKFITADDSFAETILKSNIPCSVLNSDFRNLDQELLLLKKNFELEKPDYIFVDSYFVTANYLRQVGRYGTLVYIDDMAMFAYPVNFLVNYNIYGPSMEYRELYAGEGLKIPKMLLGSRYVPLREEFQNMTLKQQPKVIQDILISVGGADPERMALRFINCLKRSKKITDQYQFHFIISTYEPDAKLIKDMAQKLPWLIPHENVQNMSELMRSCDIAVSAAGSTLYELCACGIPTITYVLEDNQIFGAEAFERNEMMLNIGDARFAEDFEESFLDKIEKLGDDVSCRTQMSETAHKLIDGNGAFRLINDLLNSK